MKNKRVWMAASAVGVAVGVCVAALLAGNAEAKGKLKFKKPKPPLGLVSIIWPPDNKFSPAKAELGWLLYFDKRLSIDNTISCASCHDPKKGFTDQAPVATGIRGQKGGRSAPTVINRAYSVEQFWDGRAPSLEAQAIGPIANPIEMGETHEHVVKKLQGIPGYAKRFKKVFGTEDFTIEDVGKALATFERTVLSGNSPYDRYRAGDKNALTTAQKLGLELFRGKARCNNCHFGINFTDGTFVNVGAGMDKPNPDPGRMDYTKRPEDFGSFKTPTLREIEHTAPYMHDGSLKTLIDVVEHYNKARNKFPDPRVKVNARIIPLKLTQQEKQGLVEFLKALSGEGWQHVTAPTEFPE